MLMRHVQDFWGDWPLEKRMDPVLKMEILKSQTNSIH